MTFGANPNPFSPVPGSCFKAEPRLSLSRRVSTVCVRYMTALLFLEVQLSGDLPSGCSCGAAWRGLGCIPWSLGGSCFTTRQEGAEKLQAWPSLCTSRRRVVEPWPISRSSSHVPRFPDALPRGYNKVTTTWAGWLRSTCQPFGASHPRAPWLPPC